MNWRKLFKKTGVVLLILFLAFCVSSWIVAGKLVRPANRAVSTPEDLAFETLTLESESGSSLAAWFVPAENASATIVLLHPLRGNRQTMLGRARLLHDAGFDLLMFDFQAHGESPGEKLTMGHLEKHDARAAIEYAKRRSPDQRIGVVGWSLGGASALLADASEIDALVLESVYPTISQAVYNRTEIQVGSLKHVFAPTLLLQMWIRLGITPDDLRPIDYLKRLDCPVLIAGGDCDLHTPLVETESMFEAAPEPKTLVVFEGAMHKDLLAYDAEKYSTAIVGFFNQHLSDE